MHGMIDFEKMWEGLTLSNDYLFSKVMRDKELCKGLLERLLDIRIERIEFPSYQKVIDIRKDSKSVRLDIYVADGEGTVFEVEMQASDTKDLPLRSRYYRSMIDLDLLEKGISYKKLNRSYVIFICTSDVFRMGRHRYTFENSCREEAGLMLGDGTTTVFFNTKGTLDDVSRETKAFLEFVDGKQSDDEFVRRLDDAIKKAKSNEGWRREYMTLLMRDQENIEKGIQKGVLNSIKSLIKKGWTVDEAMSMLDVPEEDQPEYTEEIKSMVSKS